MIPMRPFIDALCRVSAEVREPTPAHTQPIDVSPDWSKSKPIHITEALKPDPTRKLVLPSMLDKALREGWHDTGERRHVGLSQPVHVLTRAKESL